MISEVITIPEGWRKVNLGKSLRYIKGKKPMKLYDKPSDGRLRYLIVDSLTSNAIKYADKSEGTPCNVEDILVIADGSRSGHVFTGYNGLVSSTFLLIKPKEGVFLQKYLFYLLRSMQLTAIRYRKGGAIPHFDSSTLETVNIIIPPIKKQKKIVDILQNNDQAIEQTEKIIKESERIKKGLIKDLIEKQMGKNPNWKFYHFNEIFNGPRRGIKKDPERIYKRVIVKRGFGGVVLRDEKKGSDIQVNNQFEVKANDFLISKRQVFHGAIGIVPPELDSSIVSNEYESLTCKNGFNIDFLFYCAKTRQFKRTIFQRTQGVDKEKFRFLFDDWKETTGIFLPPLNEQDRINNIIAGIDNRIELENKKLLGLVKMKKGLMKNLLTGKIRVKVD